MTFAALLLAKGKNWVFMNMLQSRDDFGPAYEEDLQVRTLNQLFTIFHLILFIGVMLCFAATEIFGATGKTILVRQVGYTTYALIILISIGGYWREIGLREVFYMSCAVVVAMAVFFTNMSLGRIRLIDYFGAPSFIIGVYVFSVVLPRAWGKRTEMIIVSALLLQIAALVWSLYTGTGSVFERSNALTAYTGLGAVVLIGIGSRRGLSVLKRFFCFGGAALIGLIMARALGRTSVIATISTFLFVVWVGSTFRRKLLWITLLALVIAVLVFSGYADLLIERFVYKAGFAGRRLDIHSLTGRIDVWREGLREAGGMLWLGKGKLWIFGIAGTAAHSSYFGSYFQFGIFAIIPWLIMCAIGFWAAIKVLLLYKPTGRYPLAPFCVIYFLILGLAESYFSVMIGGFGVLFYIGCGQCLLEIRRAKEYKLLAQIEQDERTREYPAYQVEL